jgi:hypothetical protein
MGCPRRETLDKAAYTCLLVSYRRLSAQFQFSLSAVTLGYLSHDMYHRDVPSRRRHLIFNFNGAQWGPVYLLLLTLRPPFFSPTLASYTSSAEERQAIIPAHNRLHRLDPVLAKVALRPVQ